MAIAEMSSMTLVGLISEKDKLLDGFTATGAVQITEVGDVALTSGFDAEEFSFGEEEARARACADFIEREYDAADKKIKEKNAAPALYGVTMEEFLSVPSRFGEIREKIERTEERIRAKSGTLAEINALTEEKKGYLPYVGLEDKFSAFADTDFTKVVLGLVPSDKTAALSSEFEGKSAYFIKLADGESGDVVAAVFLKRDGEEAEKTLSLYGFNKCGFSGDFTAREKIADIDGEIAENEKALAEISEATVKDAEFIRDIRLYIDYIGFIKEKQKSGEGFRRTAETFVMKAFVPTEDVEKVKTCAENTATAVFTEFKPVPRDEYAPTLMKNNKVVSNFEAVTNMYSAPAYGALDPNAVMSFFFAMFMGLIMADAGYGVLMIIGGLLLSEKARRGTTMQRFGKVFAIGGIFAVVFGLLFDSVLGFQVLRTYLGSDYRAFYDAHIDPINAISSVAGINVPTMLLWCLCLGTLQIAVSLVLKAVQCFGRKQIAEGIFSGLVWALALVAFVVFVFGMVKENATLTTYFGYGAVGLFAVGILTSGITAKGLGKVTKTFGSLYGLINYMSDILSYARLYGLMLSGAQIASIFTNTLALGMLFPTGVVGIIFGVVIIIVGNVFNLAMSLLGAYIHDARLQYVEFFGRFYEGEGELFTPIGYSREYVYFK